MRIFTTLFDKSYLSRGLALFASLEAHAGDFLLYVLAMDGEVEEALKLMPSPRLQVIPQREFQNDELKRIEKERSRAEYCWTCTPYLLDFLLLKHPEFELVTYLDADLYFYSSPEPLLLEMGNASSLITPHFYLPKYDNTKAVGKYCVQFMPFKNSVEGKKVLTWWKEACLEWCFNREEDGKMGDQKYLDDWPTLFPNEVKESTLRGGGIAPWNAQSYRYELTPSFLNFRFNDETSPVIFYHFQGLKFSRQPDVMLTGPKYFISKEVYQFIYLPYLKKLFEIQKKLKSKSWHHDPHGTLNILEVKTVYRFLVNTYKFFRELTTGNHNRLRKLSV